MFSLVLFSLKFIEKIQFRLHIGLKIPREGHNHETQLSQGNLYGEKQGL